jgi:hypothetical protein
MINLPRDLERFLGRLVVPHGCSEPPNGEALAIDLLARAIEAYRIQTGRLENRVSFEWFLQGHLELGDERLHFSAPAQFHDFGSGTPPIVLQPTLLVFLLLHHDRHRQVLDAIEAFIASEWDQLESLDFKRTRTGVLRCVTNTRFAANTLRKYGLLKFTRREAYKTWVLSLPGALLAAELAPRIGLLLKPCEPTRGVDLHPEILRPGPDWASFDAFLGRLEALCKPKAEFFRTFDTMLRRAYELLPGYWAAMRDSKRSREDRRKACLERLQLLEQHPETERFYQQLAMHLRTQLVATHKGAPSNESKGQGNATQKGLFDDGV